MTIDGIRYFCTGDIGQFTPTGNLMIIDRKKVGEPHARPCMKACVDPRAHGGCSAVRVAVADAAHAAHGGCAAVRVAVADAAHAHACAISQDLVKLQMGEYVALSKVENVLKTCKYTQLPMVYASSTMSYCIALICPNIPKLTVSARPPCHAHARQRPASRSGLPPHQWHPYP